MKDLHARVAGEVRKVVVGHDEALEDMLAALVRAKPEKDKERSS